MNRPSVPLLLVLFLAALAIRLVYLWDLSHLPFFDVVLTGFDHFNFDRGAENFARGDWLARSPNNSYSPLYKYFLGVLYFLFGRNFYVVYTVQFLLGAGASVLVYLIARDRFGSLAAVFAFLGFALYATEIFYEGVILRAAFLTFFGVLSCYLLLRLEEGYRPLRLAAAALALSMFFQARPNTLLVLPLVLVFLHRSVLTSVPEGRRFRGWGIFGGTLILSFVPLLVQCYLVHGRFVLFDASGPTAFVAGNLVAYPGAGYDAGLVHRYTQDHALEYGAVLQYLLQQVGEQPLEFLLLYLRKIYFFFNDLEPPSNLSFYLYEENSRVLPWLWSGFSVFSALGLVGMGLAVRRRKNVFLLLSFAGALFLSVVLFHVVARFRVTAAPFFVIFAGYALSLLVEGVRKRDFRNLGLPLAASAGLVAVFQAPEGMLKIRQVDYCNLAVAYFNRPDQFDLEKIEHNAVQCWNVERTVDRSHPFSRSLLATLYNLYGAYLLNQGEGEQLDPYLHRSRKIEPFQADAYRLLAEAAWNRGEPGRARRWLQIGLAARPKEKLLLKRLVRLYHDTGAPAARILPVMGRWRDLETDPEMRSALIAELEKLSREVREHAEDRKSSLDRGRSYFAAQRWEAAFPEYRRVNAANATIDSLFLEEGLVLGNLGRYEEALDAFYNGLLINPDHPEIHRVLSEYYLSVDRPAASRVHLKRYLEGQAPGAAEKRYEINDRALRAAWGNRTLEPILKRLRPEDNRELYQLFAAAAS